MRLLKQKILIVLLGVYALVFGELFLRALAPQALMPRYVTGTEWGIRGNVPNAVYRQKTAEVDVEVRINAQGLRADRSYSMAKPVGTCRLAFLGDSYFLGYEVAREDGLVALVETGLKQAGYRVEALNFAVSGFGTAEMLILLNRDVARYEPDLVVFQWHASDFDDNLRADLFRLQGDALVPGQAVYLPGVGLRDTLSQFAAYRWLIANSHLYTAVREKAGRFSKDLLAKFRGGGVVSVEATAVETHRRSLAAALLAEGLARAEAIGAAWRVFEIPVFGTRTRITGFFENLPLTRAVRTRATSAAGVLNAAADVGTKLYFERGHRHLTELGNRLAAGRLVADILIGNAARLARCRRAA